MSWFEWLASSKMPAFCRNASRRVAARSANSSSAAPMPSSRMRISGFTEVAMENARRARMPDE